MQTTILILILAVFSGITVYLMLSKPKQDPNQAIRNTLFNQKLSDKVRTNEQRK